MTQIGHNVDDIRLIQLTTTLLVLLIVNVITIWIFVNNIFNISIYLVASLTLELIQFVLIESQSLELILLNICLWLTVSFNGKHCIFDCIAATEQMIMCKDDHYYLQQSINFSIS